MVILNLDSRILIILVNEEPLGVYDAHKFVSDIKHFKKVYHNDPFLQPEMVKWKEKMGGTN